MSRPNIQKQAKTSSTTQAADWLKPVGTALGILLLLAGLDLLWKSFNAAPADTGPIDFRTHGLSYFWNLYFTGGKGHKDLITGAALLGGALGALGIAWGVFDPSPPKAAMKPGVYYGLGAALAVFMTFFILKYGMHQIGGYDQANLVDSSWRLLKGQTAYVDFPLTLPVSYTLGGKFAFQWFGVRWRSFIDIMALFSIPTFAWSLFLLAKLFGRCWTSLLWAVTLQIISPAMAAYWTYNPITAVTAVLYTFSASYWLLCPAEKIPMVSYGASLFLLSTMKPNVAGILIAGVSVILFVSPKHRWKVLWISLGAFMLFLVFLVVNNMSFTGTIHGYLSVAKRGAFSFHNPTEKDAADPGVAGVDVAHLVPFLIGLNPLEKHLALIILISILLPSVLALGRSRDNLRSLIPWIPIVVMLVGFLIFINDGESTPVGEATIFLPVLIALCLGWRNLRSFAIWIPAFVLLAGLYGFITNSEQKLVDMPPVLCAAVLLAARLRGPASSSEGPLFEMPIWWNRYLALACLVFSGVGLVQGISRDRIQSIGPVQFFEWDDSRHVIADGFFKGEHCGDVFDEVVKEVADVLRREPTASVWFGPRMQWGYAAFEKSSPLHEPVIWDPLTMFNNTQRAVYFNNFLQNRRQLLILFKNDLTNYDQDEIQQIVERYNVDQSYPLLTVLRMKK